jgi:hypothetical protein
MTCVILQNDLESAEDQPCASEHPSRSGEDLSGRESGSTKDLFGSPEVLQRRRVGKATTSLLLRSLQIQCLDQLLNQSVIGNYFLYSQSIMVIDANANYCTHLSCNSWEDTTFEGTCHKRQVNGVLGSLMHLHYPGEVTRSDGTSSPATCWADYALAPDATYGTAQGIVWSDFWVSFFVILFQSFIPNTLVFTNA